MGTRNLTAVMKDGEYKVAQYGQWDGCPEGQGLTILNFIRTNRNIENLKAALSKVRFLDEEGQDKDFMEEYKNNAPAWSNDPDNRTPEQIRWFESYISGDLGGEILKSIADSDDDEIVIKNDIDFASDSLFCEWAYVLDFDSNTFEVFRGFCSEPHDGRFTGSKSKDGYYPVTLFKSFHLDNLPDESDFLSQLVEEDE